MTSTAFGHGLGLVRQLPDGRDYHLELPTSGLPPRVDLRTSPYRPDIWDQKQLGSCTAFAASRVAEQTYGIDGFHNQFQPSTLFLYYNSRDLEGTADSDAGATMRDTMKALAANGMCAEHWCPYSDADPGPFSQKPSNDAYANAVKHKAISYHAVDLTLGALKGCLAQGFPLMVGIIIYPSFEKPKNGNVPMPDIMAEVPLGGHAVTVQGYDDVTQLFTLDNSWGASWGSKGSFTLPYAYMTYPDLCFDAWTIRLMK